MYICIYVYIEVSAVALILQLILDAAASCGRGSVRCLERAKHACSPQTVFVRAKALPSLALLRAAIWLPQECIRCSEGRSGCSGRRSGCSWNDLGRSGNVYRCSRRWP